MKQELPTTPFWALNIFEHAKWVLCVPENSDPDNPRVIVNLPFLRDISRSSDSVILDWSDFEDCKIVPVEPPP